MAHLPLAFTLKPFFFKGLCLAIYIYLIEWFKPMESWVVCHLLYLQLQSYVIIFLGEIVNWCFWSKLWSLNKGLDTMHKCTPVFQGYLCHSWSVKPIMFGAKGWGLALCTLEPMVWCAGAAHQTSSQPHHCYLPRGRGMRQVQWQNQSRHSCWCVCTTPNSQPHHPSWCLGEDEGPPLRVGTTGDTLPKPLPPKKHGANTLHHTS